MNCYAELLKEYEIFMPKYFVTGRELAHVNTLDELYPKFNKILCRWHLNMIVVVTKKWHFKDQDSFDKFYSSWNTLINSQILDAYNPKSVELRKQKPSAVKFVKNT